MKKTLLILTAIIMTAVTHAMPALKIWQTFTQSDGTTIKVMLCGDETMHYYVTEDMVPLVRAKNGDFCLQMGHVTLFVSMSGWFFTDRTAPQCGHLIFITS